MSRIRSVHPGLFTDESFVSLSDAAQIFWIGLWTEADDNGIFEWKPISLKMKLRAASMNPVEPLLAELVESDCVRQFEVGGRRYGAIRNFGRFQHPKFPKPVHPIPDDLRSYVSLTPPPTETKPVDAPPIPRKAETPLLMENVMEDGEEKTDANASSVAPRKRKQPIRFFIEDEPIHPNFAKVAARFPQYDADEQWAACRDWHLKRGQGTACMGATANTWLKGAGRFSNGTGFINGKPAKPTLADDARAIAEGLGIQPGRMDDFADPAGGTVIDNADPGGLDRRAAA